MVEPSLTDRSKAKALARGLRTSFLDWCSDYSPYFFCTFIFIALLADQLFNHLPFDLPLIAKNIALLIVFTGSLICSFFLLRKLRSRHNRELEVVYEELFREGIDEDLVGTMVKHPFMYINLPKQVSEREKQDRQRAKREGWDYDQYDSPGGE